jgi:predicted CXXCH cytochrome family protein
LIRAGVLGLALGASLAFAGQADDVYRSTAHGGLDGGVSRTSTVPKGHCLQCHVRQLSPGGAPKALFTTNDNTLCFLCHDTATPSGTFGGQALYTTSAHWGSGAMLWPGPTPAARPPGDEGKCLNCHTPHGARDARGLIADQVQVREESLCLACHDATGPSRKNINGEVGKFKAHNPGLYVQKHVAGESSPAAFASGAARHVECPDCHNPHRAMGPDGGAVAILAGVSRVRFDWTGGNQFTFLTNGDSSSPVKEYEICFKCHSSWTTLDAGQKDKAYELDPRAGSFHPVVAPGTNTNTAIMNANLAGGTGLPHLTTTSLVECSDCHASDAMPLTITSVSGYQGAVPRGPHGSNISAAGYSTALLRARYKITGSPGTLTTDAELCGICHSLAFTTSGTATTRFGALNHHRSIGLCSECHSDLHGARLGQQPTNASYSRLVNFASTVTGPSGTGAPSWTAKGATGNGSCNLTCHGTQHSPKSY